jgi:hypothetical protein
MAKTGKQLLEELLQKSRRKVDVIAPVRSLHMDDDGTMAVPVPADAGETFADLVARPVGNAHKTMPVAAGQLAQYLGIPKRYYDRCATEAPELLAAQVNGWTDRRPADERRMLRTYQADPTNGEPAQLRALLSPRFRRIDNYDLVRQCAPVFQEKGVIPFRSFLTESRMDLSLASNDIVAELGGMDRFADGGHEIRDIRNLVAVLDMGNSEVGKGGISVAMGVADRGCRNLYIGVSRFVRVHLGREIQGEGVLEDILTDEARRAADEALWLQIRDLVNAAFNEEQFRLLVEKYQAARAHKVDRPVETIRLVAAREDLDGDKLLEAFMQQPEPTAFGITQAITLAAQDEQLDDETQARMCKLAGQAIEENASGEKWAKWLAAEEATVAAEAAAIEAQTA